MTRVRRVEISARPLVCNKPEFGMAKTNPFTFIQQVRAETSKVTWPARRETAITTVMVFVMVLIASIFFLLADQLMGWGVGLLLGVNG